MTIIATDSNRFSTVVKMEFDPASGYCRDVVTVNDSAATFKVGAVLGKVTATGKYKLVEASATDGSEVAAAVFVADKNGNSGSLAIAGSTDTSVLVLARGPVIVSKAALSFGASVDSAPELAAAYAQLKAVGILAETSV